MKPTPSNSLDLLKSAIVRLEEQQAKEGKVLRDQLGALYDRFTPANLLKSALGAMSESKPQLLATSVGLSLGVLSKALFEGTSAGPVRKMMGTLLLFGITKVVSPAIITSVGKVLGKMSRKNSDEAQEVFIS